MKYEILVLIVWFCFASFHTCLMASGHFYIYMLLLVLLYHTLVLRVCTYQVYVILRSIQYTPVLFCVTTALEASWVPGMNMLRFRNRTLFPAVLRTTDQVYHVGLTRST